MRTSGRSGDSSDWDGQSERQKPLYAGHSVDGVGDHEAELQEQVLVVTVAARPADQSFPIVGS